MIEYIGNLMKNMKNWDIIIRRSKIALYIRSFFNFSEIPSNIFKYNLKCLTKKVIP